VRRFSKETVDEEEFAQRILEEKEDWAETKITKSASVNRATPRKRPMAGRSSALAR